jgi:hypothetical protein
LFSGIRNNIFTTSEWHFDNLLKNSIKKKPPDSSMKNFPLVQWNYGILNPLIGYSKRLLFGYPNFKPLEELQQDVTFLEITKEKCYGSSTNANLP